MQEIINRQAHTPPFAGLGQIQRAVLDTQELFGWDDVVLIRRYRRFAGYQRNGHVKVLDQKIWPSGLHDRFNGILSDAFAGGFLVCRAVNASPRY